MSAGKAHSWQKEVCCECGLALEGLRKPAWRHWRDRPRIGWQLNLHITANPQTQWLDSDPSLTVEPRESHLPLALQLYNEDLKKKNQPPRIVLRVKRNHLGKAFGPKAANPKWERKEMEMTWKSDFDSAFDLPQRNSDGSFCNCNLSVVLFF